MKKILFSIISVFLLGGCSAFVKESGYSATLLVNKILPCDNFSFDLNRVVYRKRFEIVGPLIPIFPFWEGSNKVYGLALESSEGLELDDTYCPDVRVNGVQQELGSFDVQRNRCSYRLGELDQGDSIELEVEHLRCGARKIIFTKFEKWKYLPPGAVTR